MNTLLCAIPCDSTGLVEHLFSYLFRMNADSLSFITKTPMFVLELNVAAYLEVTGYRRLHNNRLTNYAAQSKKSFLFTQ